MDRGAWWALVHGVAKSRIRLSESLLVSVCKVYKLRKLKPKTCYYFHFLTNAIMILFFVKYFYT